jgi:hypothetical protein
MLGLKNFRTTRAPFCSSQIGHGNAVFRAWPWSNDTVDNTINKVYKNCSCTQKAGGISMANEVDVKLLETAASSTRLALGLPTDANADKVAAAINKLARDHNVLINYQMRPLPTHAAGQLAKSALCLCACVCACID